MSSPMLKIIDALEAEQFAIVPLFLPHQLTQTILEEMRVLWNGNHFNEAKVGQSTQTKRHSEIRSDFIYWLDEPYLTLSQRMYWQKIESLRHCLNRHFFLGLSTFEAHFAIYPVGAFYKRHLDQHKGSNRRQISCILYLNPNWLPQDGGQLRLFPQKEQWDNFIDVAPEAGTLVCFRCDSIYHAVLPASRRRYSITGWLGY